MLKITGEAHTLLPGETVLFFKGIEVTFREFTNTMMRLLIKFDRGIIVLPECHLGLEFPDGVKPPPEIKETAFRRDIRPIGDSQPTELHANVEFDREAKDGTNLIAVRPRGCRYKIQLALCRRGNNLSVSAFRDDYPDDD